MLFPLIVSKNNYSITKVTVAICKNPINNSSKCKVDVYNKLYRTLRCKMCSFCHFDYFEIHSKINEIHKNWWILLKNVNRCVTLNPKSQFRQRFYRNMIIAHRLFLHSETASTIEISIKSAELNKQMPRYKQLILWGWVTCQIQVV